MTRPIHKLLRLGTVRGFVPHEPPNLDFYVEVEHLTGRNGDKWELSITSCVGPRANGDAWGGYNQSIPDVEKFTGYAPGWDAAKVARLVEVWEAWHLNAMRAGCEHQRANWNPSEEVEIVTYRLTSDAIHEQGNIERRIKAALKARGAAAYEPGEKEIAELPFETTQTPDADSPASGRYEVHKRENKTTGWLRPTEHPRGLLMKPCEVCGYRYGSAWLYEPVPDAILDEIESWPDADTITPGARRWYGDVPQVANAR